MNPKKLCADCGEDPTPVSFVTDAGVQRCEKCHNKKKALAERAKLDEAWNRKFGSAK